MSPMLSFAPPTVNDELLYSYVSRWFRLSGHATVKTFNDAAFGTQIVHDVLNAHRFTPLKWTGGLVNEQARVAETMTFIPLARLFLGEVAYVEYFGYGDDSGSNAKASLTRLGEPWRLSELRYCEHCAAEHQRLIGRGAWLRSHNLPGVSACHIHGVRLQRQPFVKGRLTVVPRLTPSVQSSFAKLEEVRYAEIMAQLLEWQGPVVHMAQWEAALRVYVSKFCQGAPRRKTVRDYFNEVYSTEFLTSVGHSLNDLWRSPLDKLLEARVRETHPTYTVLLAELLCKGGIVELIDHALSYKVSPFTSKDLAKYRRAASIEKRSKDAKLRVQDIRRRIAVTKASEI